MDTAPPVGSANHATLVAMTPVPPPLSLRLGRNGAKALDDLARLRGVTKAQAARQAIEEAAQRERRRGGLRAEAARLMNDPSYPREALALVDLMEDLA